MNPFNLIVHGGGRLLGRIFSRVFGPIGLALTIGECTYLGLKYSGTLDKFKNLYCSNCRREIPNDRIQAKARRTPIGQQFYVPCPHCGEPHRIDKIGEPCRNCKALLPSTEIVSISQSLDPGQPYHIRCPQCHVNNRLVKI